MFSPIAEKKLGEKLIEVIYPTKDMTQDFDMILQKPTALLHINHDAAIKQGKMLKRL